MSVNEMLILNTVFVFISFLGVLYHRQRLLRCIMAILPAFFACGTTLCLSAGAFAQASGALAGIFAFCCGALCTVFALAACFLFLKKRAVAN